jgi:putative transposase
MSSYACACPRLSFEQALAPFLQDQGLPFGEVLPAAVVEQALLDEEVAFGDTEQSVFTPAVTLWAFLSQVLEEDKSCRAAVNRVVALCVALGQEPCSQDTAAYCRARAKLPAAVLKHLALQTSQHLEAQVPAEWLWHGRHAKLVDGTTLTMPDTAANQEAFPQLSSQEPGVGFPILRMVVVLSLASAGLLSMALAPYEGKETGETALLRQLLEEFHPGDVLVADRYYCTYWLVAMAQALGVDVVFRMHHRRDYDFRRGQQLGANDHVVSWQRPERPDWMDQATYLSMPRTLTVREFALDISTPGCRTAGIVVVTTLLDAVAYAKEEVGDLYHERWQVELDIRAIKQTLHMDHLRCKSPFMIDKEIWVHFLGYNLVRQASCQAALLQEVHPREVSFTATKQTINAARSQLTLTPRAERLRQGLLFLYELGKERVGNRPDRYEPRVLKKRPKQYPHLREPRAQARARLLQNHTAEQHS